MYSKHHTCTLCLNKQHVSRYGNHTCQVCGQRWEYEEDIVPKLSHDQLNLLRDNLECTESGGWIRICEQQPEEGEEVIIWAHVTSSKRQYCTLATYLGFDASVRYPEIPYRFDRTNKKLPKTMLNHVVHWMPLPKSPTCRDDS